MPSGKAKCLNKSKEWIKTTTQLYSPEFVCSFLILLGTDLYVLYSFDENLKMNNIFLKINTWDRSRLAGEMIAPNTEILFCLRFLCMYLLFTLLKLCWLSHVYHWENSSILNVFYYSRLTSGKRDIGSQQMRLKWLVGWGLWRINLCCLSNAKSCLYVYLLNI